MKNEVRQHKPRLISTYLRLAPMVFRSAPGTILLSAAISIAHGVSWGIQAMFQQNFFDAATALVGGNAVMGALAWAFALMMLAQVACQVLNGVDNYRYTPQSQAVTRALSHNMHLKMARLDPLIFEDNSKLDVINKATEGMTNAVYLVDIFNVMFLFYLPYFITMGTYMFTLKPEFLWVMAIVFVPTALTQIVRTKYFSKLEDESAPVRREFEYYEKCVADREYFKETRALGGFWWFRRQYDDSLRLLNRLRMGAITKSTLFELASRTLTIGGYFAILMMLLNALMAGEISVGAFAAVFTNIQMIFSLMEEIIYRHVGNMVRWLSPTANYVKFLDLPERGGAPMDIPDGDIELNHVSFSYPGSDKKALSDITFTIHRGETLAIVGENGAGKSTFTRLVTGMYAPNEGCVRRGGVDLREADLPSLRRGVSAVFQKFRRYKLTLRENLALAGGTLDCPDAVLNRACEQSGLDTDAAYFPQGMDTMLTREFDDEAEGGATHGVDLSGGQWQRVATARAYCREHDLIILDEPTAAIDPLEETRTYDRFARLAKDKTALIVTHRLGSVRLADRILVLDGGRVAEVGTHEELMAKGGTYARMFENQRQWYM